MSDSRFSGSCLCGRVRFEIEPPTRFCAHCHCSNCRRAHGAAFVTWVGLPDKQFHVIDGADALRRFTTDTGATRSFCKHCGSTLTYVGPRWEGEVHVARANIPGEIDRSPSGHVYVDHRPDWSSIDDSLPQHGGESGMEPKNSSAD